jgi:hypothetical protein
MNENIGGQIDRRRLARGEATSRIHWGAQVEEVFELLRANYGIEGNEAEVIVSDALAARRNAIRKKASIALAFALFGLAVSVSYFAIRGFVGFMVVGFGPILMMLLGLASLVMAFRSIARIMSGDSPGAV